LPMPDCDKVGTWQEINAKTAGKTDAKTLIFGMVWKDRIGANS